MIKVDFRVFHFFFTATYHMAIIVDGFLGQFLSIACNDYKFSFVII